MLAGDLLAKNWCNQMIPKARYTMSGAVLIDLTQNWEHMGEGGVHGPGGLDTSTGEWKEGEETVDDLSVNTTCADVTERGLHGGGDMMHAANADD